MAAEHRTLVLAPVGQVMPGALPGLLEEVREAFGCEVQWGPPLALPEEGWSAERQQLHAAAVVDVLAAARRPEWARLLGVVDVDLFVPELNFVFGLAERQRGVAVFSLARLHAPPGQEALFHRRAATEAIHELGHTFALGHCAHPDCVMWFSNTLAESDRKGTRFCAAHAAQLRSAS